MKLETSSAIVVVLVLLCTISVFLMDERMGGLEATIGCVGDIRFHIKQLAAYHVLFRRYHRDLIEIFVQQAALCRFDSAFLIFLT